MKNNRENPQYSFAFYTYKDEPDILYLANVFVAEENRCYGIGTQILEIAELAAKNIGAASIRLKVKQNSKTQEWYYKHGYRFLMTENNYNWLEKSVYSAKAQIANERMNV